MVRKTARCFLEAGLRPLVAVVSLDPRLVDALAGLPLTIVENAHPEMGISRSIATGLKALPETTDAVLIGVADQPYLTAEAIEELIGAFSPGRIVVPRWGDHRGNPPVFDRRFFAELLALDGDHGGQRVIAAHAGGLARLGDCGADLRVAGGHGPEQAAQHHGIDPPAVDTSCRRQIVEKRMQGAHLQFLCWIQHRATV